MKSFRLVVEATGTNTLLVFRYAIKSNVNIIPVYRKYQRLGSQVLCHLFIVEENQSNGSS